MPTIKCPHCSVVFSGPTIDYVKGILLKHQQKSHAAVTTGEIASTSSRQPQGVRKRPSASVGDHDQPSTSRAKSAKIGHQCNLCEKVLPTTTALNEHRLKAHLVVEPGKTVVRGGGKNYNEQYYDDRKFACKLNTCPCAFTTAQNQRKHMLSCHTADYSEEAETKLSDRPKCDLCGYVYNSKSDLQDHNSKIHCR